MAAWTEQAMLQEAAVTSSNVCVRVCVCGGGVNGEKKHLIGVCAGERM